MCLVEQFLLVGFKYFNCLEQVFVCVEWSDVGYVEGFMLDVYEWVVEGVFSNLLLVFDGIFVVFDLWCCGVVGVMCVELFECVEGIGVLLVIWDVFMVELVMVDEVFLCNSQFGIWLVWVLDEYVWLVGELICKL